MIEKLKCFNYGFCKNNAIGEADLGDGNGIKFYCRKCMIECCDPDNAVVDDSLIFCEREFNEQANQDE